MKKFYQTADIAENSEGFTIELDGRPIKTPAGRSFAVASRSLARAAADEWLAQGEQINPHSMPLTGLINTALDRTTVERPAMTRAAIGFAATDLLCYRAEDPDDLVELQQENWQPLLDWAHNALGARLVVTAGVLAINQPAGALGALEKTLAEFDDLHFTAVSSLAAVCGSLVVSLALAHGQIDAAQAFEISELDSIYQARQWGTDAEAEARQNALRTDIAAAETILSQAGKMGVYNS